MSVHEPIDTDKGQIRLLRLLLGRAQDYSMIHCELHIVNLDEDPSYYALSYEWGPKTPVRAIRVGRYHLTVRDNLWQFLHMFRSQEANDRLLGSIRSRLISRMPKNAVIKSS